MSYSIWTTSYWYTHWQAPREDIKEDRNTANFCVCILSGKDFVFSARELRENRSKCIKTISMRDKYATNQDLKELNKYIDQFIKEVDIKYPLDF